MEGKNLWPQSHKSGRAGWLRMGEGACPFCEIAQGKREAAYVYRSERHVAFMDHRPINPGHVLVIPVAHYETLLDMPYGEAGPLFELVRRVAKAVKAAVRADGVHIGVNNGRASNQLVPHVHVHVVPRFFGDAPGARMPPRKAMAFDQLRALAEEISSRLREIE